MGKDFVHIMPRSFLVPGPGGNKSFTRPTFSTEFPVLNGTLRLTAKPPQDAASRPEGASRSTFEEEGSAMPTQTNRHTVDLRCSPYDVEIWLELDDAQTVSSQEGRCRRPRMGLLRHAWRTKEQRPVNDAVLSKRRERVTRGAFVMKAEKMAGPASEQPANWPSQRNEKKRSGKPSVA